MTPEALTFLVAIAGPSSPRIVGVTALERSR
jgi:hypothetical protein